jgi:hypothetical protein
LIVLTILLANAGILLAQNGQSQIDLQCLCASVAKCSPFPLSDARHTAR